MRGLIHALQSSGAVSFGESLELRVNESGRCAQQRNGSCAGLNFPTPRTTSSRDAYYLESYNYLADYKDYNTFSRDIVL